MTQPSADTTPMPTPMSTNVGPIGLARAGLRALTQYTGMVCMLYFAQAVVAGCALFGVNEILGNAFGHRPRFAEGIAGDVVSLLLAVRAAPSAIWASLWLCLAVTLFWVVFSWFASGGLYGVLVHQPAGRDATSKAFAHAAAENFFAFAVIGLCNWIPLLVAAVALLLGVDAASPKFATAMNTRQLVGPLLLAFGPAVVVIWLTQTATAYARIAVVHARGSWRPVRAWFRAWRCVLTIPRLGLHSALGALTWLGIGCGYILLVQGHACDATVAVVILRYGSLGLRFALKVGVAAGQVSAWQALHPLVKVRAPRT